MKNKQTKRMFVASEMIAAGKWLSSMLERDEIDEITLSLGSDDEGHKWEFNIGLVRLTNTRAAIKVKLFSDSWMAFTEAPEIFEVMKAFGTFDNIGQDDERLWPLLLDTLEEAGWQRVEPIPSKALEPKVCTACGK